MGDEWTDGNATGNIIMAKRRQWKNRNREKEEKVAGKLAG